MAPNSNSQHPHARWEPAPIQLALLLGKNSMKKQVPFFKLISAEGGYDFPAGSCFTVVDERSKSVVIQALWGLHTPAVDHLSFCVTVPLKEAGIVCSKLNIASSQNCKIKAEFCNQAVLFSILAPNKTVEDRMLKHYFSLFDKE